MPIKVTKTPAKKITKKEINKAVYDKITAAVADFQTGTKGKKVEKKVKKVSKAIAKGIVKAEKHKKVAVVKTKKATKAKSK